MAAAIVRKTLKNLDMKSNTTNALLKLDKFILKTFNWLLHNQEVSGLLVASFLLSLSNHYFSKIVVKTIYIVSLKTKCELILGGQNLNQLNDIVCINNKKVR